MNHPIISKVINRASEGYLERKKDYHFLSSNFITPYLYFEISLPPLLFIVRGLNAICIQAPSAG